MDQILSIFHIDSAQIAAQLINFLLATIVLWFVALRPLGKIIKKRQETIQEGVDNALHADTLLKEAETNAQHVMREAETESQVLIGKASKTQKEIIAKAEEVSLRIQRDAEEKAKVDARNAFDYELASQSQDLIKNIVATTTNLLGRELHDTASHQEYIKKQIVS